MRPFFPYYGSKWNLTARYPAPRHKLVIEPFAGSACYSLRNDVHEAVLIDSNPTISGLWKWLIGASRDDILALPDMPDVGASVYDFDLPQGARDLIGFWLNRASDTPKRTRSERGTRNDKGQAIWGPRAKERIVSQLELIRGWTVIDGDYREAPAVTATWFVDPPYALKGRFYTKWMRPEEYAPLGEWCRELNGQVIVCEGEGADWLPFDDLGHFKNSLNGRSVEKVWFNDEQEVAA